MALPTLLKKLFQNDGAGPQLRKEIVPMQPYELCEIYYFRHPTLRPGFAPCTGSVIEHADQAYPLAYEYLQTEEGQLICKTEAEWQTMSTATYYTNASGVAEGWNGVGGVPFFVVDTEAKTIRLPDTRGMYMEAAGLDGLTVGGVHSDTMRLVQVADKRVGQMGSQNDYVNIDIGPIKKTRAWYSNNVLSGSGTGYGNGGVALGYDNSSIYPTGSFIAPRAFGVVACTYLGA